MDRTAEIIYGQTGEVVTTYPPEWLLGAPSSVTAEVYDGTRSNDDAAEFSPSVTVATTDTTVDQPSGYSQANRRILYLAETASVSLNLRYRLANASGQCELVTPIAKSDGDHLVLESDLLYDYPATTSTLKGIAMSFVVDPTWVAAEDKISGPESPPYRAIWTYTLGSVVRRHYTYLRLVRQKLTGNITVRDLLGINPDIALEEPASVRGRGYEWAISTAEERLRVDISTSNWVPDQVRDAEILNELRRRITIWVIERQKLMAGEDNAPLVEMLWNDYQALLLASIKARKGVHVDTGTEGAINVEAPAQFWFTR
jgi:hypothetical protein